MIPAQGTGTCFILHNMRSFVWNKRKGSAFVTYKCTC